MEPSYAAAYVQVMPYGVEIPNRVFVGGISYNTTELELKDFFCIYGSVLDCKIITDRNGVSRGYGFVTFASEEEARLIQSKGSLFFKEKKLNVGKAVRRQGGQYSRANQEYVNGQRNIYMHSSGLLLSQQDGNWVFEQPNPHSQPAKPFYAVEPVPMVPPQYIQPTPNMPPGTPNYIQSPPPLSVSQVYSGSYYPALPSPTYTYVAQPMPPPLPTEIPVHGTSRPPLLPPPPASLDLQKLLPVQTVGPGESNPQHLATKVQAVEEQQEEGGKEEKKSEDLSETSAGDQPDKDIAALENQTKALSLITSSVDNSPKDISSKPALKPGTNGLLRSPNSFQQPRRAPRYLNRRPAPIRSRPPQPNLHSPVYQAHVQYNCLPAYQGLQTDYFPTPLTYN